MISRAWNRLQSTGLITIRILYCSPMSQGTVLTLQIDVLECGEEMGGDFKIFLTRFNKIAKEDLRWQ